MVSFSPSFAHNKLYFMGNVIKQRDEISNVGSGEDRTK